MEETLRILIVDDDEVDRMALRRALKAAGLKLEIVEAYGCEMALKILHEQAFDCAFLDYRLPDGDGLSLVQSVRSYQIKIALVVLTGQGDEQTAVAVMKAGASDYLSKGRVSPENLSRTLWNAIRINRAEIEAAIATQKLRDSEERYRLVLEGANDGIWDWNIAANEIYCNDRLFELLGMDPEPTLNPLLGFPQANIAHPNRFLQLLHPDDLATAQGAIATHLEQDLPYHAELRFRHAASGKYRYFVVRGKAQRDRQGCPYRMSGTITDITERKQLEEALKASEARFRRLYDANMIGIMFVKLNGEITEANDAFLQMVGYSRADLQGGFLHWAEMTPPEYEFLDRLSLHDLQKFGLCTPWEKEYIRKDGSRVPIWVGAAMLENSQEDAICFVLDLSDRKRAEHEIVQLNQDLKRRVTELQTLLEVIPIGIGIAEDSLCHKIRVNSCFAKQLRISPTANGSLGAPESERPQHFRIYEAGRELALHELPIQEAAAKGMEISDRELEVVHNDGQVLTLLQYAAPLLDEHQQVRGAVGAFLDITERKRAEEEQRFLAEASRLLVGSLDYQTTLNHLSQLTVPFLADWCAISLLEGDQTLQPVAIAHRDPAQMAWGWEFYRRYPPNMEASRGIANVFRTGISEFYPYLSSPQLKQCATSPDHLQQLLHLNPRSLLMVPLIARGRTLGVMTLILSESPRRYTAADLRLAEDLAHRAALAVDNVRLYQEAQEVGDNLKQAILILGQQQQQLRTLQRLTNLLNQRLADLPELLRTLIRAVCDTIPQAEFGLIALRNPQTNLLELTVKVGIGTEQFQGTGFQIRDGILGQVFVTGKSLMIRGQHGPKLLDHAGEIPLSLYAVAIESAQAGRLGVLAIGNWQDATAFDEDEQRLLVAFGEQAAIAINNARMIKALEVREEQLAEQNDTLLRQNQELENQRRQIQAQNLKLLEAAQLKSQFLATMSHELRTPMNAIMGFSQLLLRQTRDRLSPPQANMVERILNNGKNLMALINDILDLSKIEAGRMELDLGEFDLGHLVMITTEELRSLAEEKNLLLRVSSHLSDPRVVNDNVRLRQVLVNLISNAIKFTNQGSVEVEVYELTHHRLAISVKDTGIGIAQEDIVHIFEEFRQVDQTLTKRYQGTGLGLAITDWLVQMMNGAITVESTLGIGSTFRVELPRQVVPLKVPC